MRVQLDSKPHVSEQATSKRLDGLLFTVKMVRAVPMQWNTAERKVERQQFATWLLTETADVHKVLVDEFGINVWTARMQGRAVRGERAVRLLEGQRGNNLTIYLAVSPILGLVHFSYVDGGIDTRILR